MRIGVENYVLLKNTTLRMLFNNNNFNAVLIKDNFQIYLYFYTNSPFKFLFFIIDFFLLVFFPLLFEIGNYITQLIQNYN